MKSPDYVHAVTSVYRAVLDRVLAAEAARAEGAGSDGDEDAREDVRATDEERRVLAEAFSRGFTTAYLEGERGNDIMSYGRPNNRGVLVGRVASVRDGKAADRRPARAGRAATSWSSGPSAGISPTRSAEIRHDQLGQRAHRSRTRPVGKGDRVFRVRSAADAFADDSAGAARAGRGPRAAAPGGAPSHRVPPAPGGREPPRP